MDRHLCDIIRLYYIPVSPTNNNNALAVIKIESNEFYFYFPDHFSMSKWFAWTGPVQHCISSFCVTTLPPSFIITSLHVIFINRRRATDGPTRGCTFLLQTKRLFTCCFVISSSASNLLPQRLFWLKIPPLSRSLFNCVSLVYIPFPRLSLSLSLLILAHLLADSESPMLCGDMIVSVRVFSVVADSVIARRAFLSLSNVCLCCRVLPFSSVTSFSFVERIPPALKSNLIQRMIRFKTTWSTKSDFSLWRSWDILFEIIKKAMILCLSLDRKIWDKVNHKSGPYIT